MISEIRAPSIEPFAWEVEPNPVKSELLWWRDFRDTVADYLQQTVYQLAHWDLLPIDRRALESAKVRQVNQLMDLDYRIACLEGRVRCSAR